MKGCVRRGEGYRLLNGYPCSVHYDNVLQCVYGERCFALVCPFWWL
jgi:hypothetical protein